MYSLFQMAEMEMKKAGMGWKWMADDNLQVWNIMEAFIHLPGTREEIFFNQITLNHASNYTNHPIYGLNECELSEHPLHVQYGDGEEFEEEFLDQIRTASWNNATAIKMEKGDLIVIDNLVVQHARMSYEGDERVMSAVLLS